MQITQSSEGKNKLEFNFSRSDISHNNHVCIWVEIDPFTDFICNFVIVLTMLFLMMLLVWFEIHISNFPLSFLLLIKQK